ncbi:hypothetical protein BG261_02965 [Floricoccus tropicus]|uniref:PcfK-like protein n=1 Tax=Floricoccus tropicus TaxID=1859473 RepID=A0A1E8GNI0_9LACT|nr:Cas9 inhibitor AcrIIA9 family protein [Floricoccus tropicus]OFI49556.1 hypothetical protein BG261_02965 [Floricoccus tropicus]
MEIIEIQTDKNISNKDKALKKMLKEVEHTSYEPIHTIHNWLCDQDDEELFISILKSGKTISNAFNYAGSKSREQAFEGCAMVEHDQVFEWVREYYLSDATAVARVTLSDPGERARRNLEKQNKKLKNAAVIKTKKKKNDIDPNQTTIFDFM